MRVEIYIGTGWGYTFYVGDTLLTTLCMVSPNSSTNNYVIIILPDPQPVVWNPKRSACTGLELLSSSKWGNHGQLKTKPLLYTQSLLMLVQELCIAIKLVYCFAWNWEPGWYVHNCKLNHENVPSAAWMTAWFILRFTSFKNDDHYYEEPRIQECSPTDLWISITLSNFIT